MTAEPKSYLCQVHAKFELGQEVNDDGLLVIQNSQVLPFIVLCVCVFIVGIEGIWAADLALLLSQRWCE